MRSSAEGRRLITVRACAKINLTLRVFGVRPDGFHELRTILQTLALHDTLFFVAHDGVFRLDCSEPGCPTDRTNIVWRAAERLWRLTGHRGLPAGVAVRLVKRIPMRAGLGGGSSDAAATLEALNVIWNVGAGRERLHCIARDLGADVPFFLEGGTALGVERGDHLFPLADRATEWVTLVVPGFGVSTGDAYQWFDRDERLTALRRRRGRDSPLAARRADRVAAPYGEGGNDLQRVVAARHPTIRRLVRRLERAGASYASMSGSGSTVFGLFSTRHEADRAVEDLVGPGRRVLVTRTIGRSAYRAWVRPKSGRR